MPCVVFVAPYFTENAHRLIEATATLPTVRLAVISQEPVEKLPDAIRARLVGHRRVADGLDSEQIVQATQSLGQSLGTIDHLLGAVEQLQVPLAEARERLGLPGMSAAVARNFRDKAHMKALLRAAGVPCARYQLITSEADAWAFAAEVGYPIVVKPPDGAGSQATYRADDEHILRDALQRIPPGASRAVLLEEFITGEEHSFDTISLAGKPLWHSLTRYIPSPLDAMRNPWIQWCVLLPREIDSPVYDDIRAVGWRALAVLGMETGLSHLEWFRRRDGSIAISEVAARPPGAQITTLVSRAHDIDFVQAWARLMIFGTFDPPERKYAAGAAFLRGQGKGRVKTIHGLEQANREVGHLVTDVRLPQIGQEASISYEGEGYLILRHPETAVVEQALRRLVNLIRVELGS